MASMNTLFRLLLAGLLFALSGCGGGSTGSHSGAATPLDISTQPASVSVVEGQQATLTVKATGSGTLTYQWTRNGTAIAGAVNASYVTPALTLADTGTNYAVQLSDGTTSVTSAIATVTVTAAPNVATASLASGVRLLSASEEAMIVSSTDTTVVFNTPVSFAPGTIVMGAATAFKVISTASVAGQTTLTVSEPNLEEMFSELVIKGRYLGSDGSAVPTSTGKAEALGAVRPSGTSLGNTLTWSYSISDGGFSLNATVTSDISAVIDYEFRQSAGGLVKAQMDVTANNKLDLAATYNASSSSSYEKLLGTVTIPIQVTVADAALQTVGVRIVSLRIPFYAGLSLKSDFLLMASGTITANGAIHLGYDQTSGPNAGSTFSGSMTPGSLNPTAPSGSPSFATLSESGSIYLRVAPALAFLDRVALLGVDTRLSLNDATKLQVVAGTPPYCLASKLDLDVEANGFFKAIGIQPIKTDVYSKTLVSGETKYIGTCQAPVAITAAAMGSAPFAYGAPITIGATVALDTSKATGSPAGSPTGNVSISAFGTSCLGALTKQSATSATTTCTITPVDSGTAVPVTVTYDGDSTYSPGSTSIGIAVIDPPYTMLGTRVTYSGQMPLGTDYVQPLTVTVGPGVELSTANLVGVSGGRAIREAIDIGEASIYERFTETSMVAVSSFSGNVYTLDQAGPTILGCSLNPISTLSGITVWCNAHKVFKNGSGAYVHAGDTVLINLLLGPPGP